TGDSGEQRHDRRCAARTARSRLAGPGRCCGGRVRRFRLGGSDEPGPDHDRSADPADGQRAREIVDQTDRRIRRAAGAAGAGPAVARVRLVGLPAPVLATTADTSAAAIGCTRTSGNRTTPSTVDVSALPLANSKNWVARTIEYGRPDSLILFSCATLAR